MRTFMSMTKAIVQQLDMTPHATVIQKGTRRTRHPA
jgi:hypothetical protein